MAGDGPEMIDARQLAGREIEFLGHCPHDEIIGLMKRARFYILPSVCYEGFPMTIAEAFACGTPVIVSDLGPQAEIVADGKTGLQYKAGDGDDLAQKVRWAWDHPTEMAEMACAARAEYEAKYTAEKNYPQLMAIYRQAFENHKHAGR
jgi:glycosyltransferase involved in cell wall biosynthesis